MYKILLPLICSGLLSACSIPAPKYSPSYENVQLLKPATAKVKVNDFTASNPSIRNISLRGNSLTSPVGNDMVDYLQEALESELEKAGLLDPNSNSLLAAVITQNDIDTAMSEASGIIAADVSITRNGRVAYKKTVQIKHTWESSFVGAVAIPRAAESYKVMAEKFLNKLFSDKDFIAALK